MATWTDLSSDFGYGTQLTSAQAQALRDNITAGLEGASGSPGLGEAVVDSAQMIDDAIAGPHISDGALTANHFSVGCVGNTALSTNAVTSAKIDIDEVSASITINSGSTSPSAETLQLPCGQFGFYPTFSVNSLNPTDEGYVTLQARILYESYGYAGIGSSSMVHPNYSPLMSFDMAISNAIPIDVTMYMKQAYVTGTGHVKWIFLKVSKKTKLIISTWEAWDHPSNGASLAIEHPFYNYNPKLHDIILINPTSRDLCMREELIDKYNLIYTSFFFLLDLQAGVSKIKQQV